MTNAKTNKKKIVLITMIFLLVIALFAGAYALFAPETEEGAKEITIEVIDDAQKSTTYEVSTDAEYLRQAMEEAEGLTFEGDESEFGLMIHTINGVTADFDINGAYWSFYVDGEYCTQGIDTQPISDGQAFQIIYTIG